MESRRVWAGVIAGVVAAMLLVGVAVGAYHAGQRHEVVTQVVGDSGGEVVRVVGGHGWGWGYGPGPGFFFFPVLLGILLIVLLVRGRRGGWGGGWGGCGPGPYGGPDAALQDWHRRAHGDVQPPAPASTSPPVGQGEA